MGISVGEYIRTIDGISKIEGLLYDDEDCKIIYGAECKYDNYMLEEITKHSFKLIDLIEKRGHCEWRIH